MPMGKKALFGLALLLCAHLALAESARVKAGNVNVRSGPAMTAKVIAKFPKGKTVTVIEVSGQWTKVSDGTVTGWVASPLIERVAETPVPTPTPRSSAGKKPPSEPVAVAPMPDRSAEPVARRPEPEERAFSLGIGGSWMSQEIGAGVAGRIFLAPIRSLPGLRIVGGVDAYFSTGKPIYVSGNVLYVLGRADSDVRPYVGGGIVYWRISDADWKQTGTNTNAVAGFVIKKHVFAEGRIIFYDGSTGVSVAAGIKL